MGETDEQYYARREAEDRARVLRRELRKKQLPRRLEILAKVKTGEITLKEGQRMIKKEERALLEVMRCNYQSMNINRHNGGKLKK